MTPCHRARRAPGGQQAWTGSRCSFRLPPSMPAHPNSASSGTRANPCCMCLQALAFPGEEPWLASDATVEAADLTVHGMAAFSVAALAASGLAAPQLPRDDAFALYALERAVEASDDLAARMAMADRLLQGRGVEPACPAGFLCACHVPPPNMHACAVPAIAASTVSMRLSWADWQVV